MKLVSEFKKLTGIPIFALWVIAFVLLFCIASYEFLASAVKVWKDSETFNHCFIVLPISIYLIWKHRFDIGRQSPDFSFGIYCLLLLLMPVWMLAYSGNIDMLGHLATFSMISLIIASALGWKIALTLWFPLIFIMFSVPIGEELIPLFQRITADMSVRLLLLSNVPVFYEGLFISIPEGQFLVAEACSGIRFFVSTVMLGALYAYLLFKSWQKRMAFVLFSIALPIFANVLRVYGTIVIGHTVSMEKAAGADHLIYGWFFFALVMILLIMVGNYFSDSPVEAQESRELVFVSTWYDSPSSRVLGLFAVFFISFFVWRAIIDFGVSVPEEVSIESLPEHFEAGSDNRDWKPNFKSYSQYNAFLDKRGTEPFEVDIIHYDGVDAESELVYWDNRVYDPEQWTLSSVSDKTINVAGIPLSYTILNVVSNRGKNRSILYWFRTRGYFSSNRVKVKLVEAFNAMRGVGRGGTFVSVSIVGGSDKEREDLLGLWVKDNFRDVYEIFSKSESF